MHGTLDLGPCSIPFFRRIILLCKLFLSISEVTRLGKVLDMYSQMDKRIWLNIKKWVTNVSEYFHKSFWISPSFFTHGYEQKCDWKKKQKSKLFNLSNMYMFSKSWIINPVQVLNRQLWNIFIDHCSA